MTEGARIGREREAGRGGPMDGWGDSAGEAGRSGGAGPDGKLSVSRDRVVLLMILAGAFLLLSFALNWKWTTVRSR